MTKLYYCAACGKTDRNSDHSDENGNCVCGADNFLEEGDDITFKDNDGTEQTGKIESVVRNCIPGLCVKGTDGESYFVSHNNSPRFIELDESLNDLDHSLPELSADEKIDLARRVMWYGTERQRRGAKARMVQQLQNADYFVSYDTTTVTGGMDDGKKTRFVGENAVLDAYCYMVKKQEQE